MSIGSKRASRARTKQPRKKKKIGDRLSLGGPLVDEQVLTVREFAALNGISPPAARSRRAGSFNGRNPVRPIASASGRPACST
jgi:hypothetical protein